MPTLKGVQPGWTFRCNYRPGSVLPGRVFWCEPIHNSGPSVFEFLSKNQRQTPGGLWIEGRENQAQAAFWAQELASSVSEGPGSTQAAPWGRRALLMGSVGQPMAYGCQALLSLLSPCLLSRVPAALPEPRLLQSAPALRLPLWLPWSPL